MLAQEMLTQKMFVQRRSSLAIIPAMGKLLGRKRLQIWIACFAILLNALAPSISHALSRMADPARMIEICSASGTRWMSSDAVGTISSTIASTVADAQAGTEQAPADSPLHHLEHCPFCMTHAGTFALPAPSSTLFAVQGGHDLFPSLFYHSPFPLFSWSAAHPRGPPAIV
jgi:hypothetical protein